MLPIDKVYVINMIRRRERRGKEKQINFVSRGLYNPIENISIEDFIGDKGILLDKYCSHNLQLDNTCQAIFLDHRYNDNQEKLLDWYCSYFDFDLKKLNYSFCVKNQMMKCFDYVITKMKNKNYTICQENCAYEKYGRTIYLSNISKLILKDKFHLTYGKMMKKVQENYFSNLENVNLEFFKSFYKKCTSLYNMDVVYRGEMINKFILRKPSYKLIPFLLDNKILNNEFYKYYIHSKAFSIKFLDGIVNRFKISSETLFDLICKFEQNNCKYSREVKYIKYLGKFLNQTIHNIEYVFDNENIKERIAILLEYIRDKFQLNLKELFEKKREINPSFHQTVSINEYILTNCDIELNKDFIDNFCQLHGDFNFTGSSILEIFMNKLDDETFEYLISKIKTKLSIGNIIKIFFKKRYFDKLFDHIDGSYKEHIKNKYRFLNHVISIKYINKSLIFRPYFIKLGLYDKEWNNIMSSIENYDFIKKLTIKYNLKKDVYLIHMAAKMNEYSSIKFLVENDCEVDEFTFYEIVKSCNFKIIKYATKQCLPWDEYTIKAGFLRGDQQILKYLISNGLPT